MIRPVVTRRPALVPVAEALARCDVARARRIDPPVRIDRQPEAEALARWTGRILKRASPRGWR